MSTETALILTLAIVLPYFMACTLYYGSWAGWLIPLARFVGWQAVEPRDEREGSA